MNISHISAFTTLTLLLNNGLSKNVFVIYTHLQYQNVLTVKIVPSATGDTIQLNSPIGSTFDDD